MQDLRLRCVTLQCTNENNNVNARVRQICNCTKQRHEQFVQFWDTHVLSLSVVELSMHDGAKVARKDKLIKRDLLCLFVLYVSHPAVGERVPLDLKISKDTLDGFENREDSLALSSQLKIVNVFAHDGHEPSKFSLAASLGFVTHAKLIVNLTGHKTTVIGDFSELDGKRAWRVAHACPRLVAMQDLSLRIKVLETRYHAQERDVVCREIEINFTQRFAGELGKFLIRDSLQKGLGDIGRADIPPILDSLRDDELLRAS